jgi:3-oxoadipate enol-lactonase
MPNLQVNGISLYYERMGEGEPLVLIAGFASHHSAWADFTTELAQNYKLILFDNRGTGQTDAPPPPYTIETMANDTIGLLKGLGIPNAHMIGTSMGAAIIQMIAIAYPTYLKKGVLISPFPKLPDPYLFHAKSIEKVSSFENISAELLIELDMPWLFSNEFLRDPDRVKQKISEWLNNPYPLKPEGHQGQLGALETFDLRKDLRKIEHEMLLLAGEEDLVSPLSCALLLKERISRATLKTFPKTGHMIYIEKKEEVLKAILSFLS